MYRTDIAIASVSWARTGEEETILCASLTALAALQVPVFITDGGSSASFATFLERFPHFNVFRAKGLWPQAKQSIRAATEAGAKVILYTEPDKHDFFLHHLPGMLQAVQVTGNTGVVLASRSAAGYATFPAFQQMTESTINQCCREVIGREVDYCYGPFFFPTQIVTFLALLDDSCGWGWRPFVFAIAHRLGLKVAAVVGDFSCPPDQRQDDETERLYRMKQLTQNIEGLVKAATIKLGKTDDAR